MPNIVNKLCDTIFFDTKNKGYSFKQLSNKTFPVQEECLEKRDHLTNRKCLL